MKKMIVIMAIPIILFLAVVAVASEPPLPSIGTRGSDHHLSDPSPSPSPLLFRLDIKRPQSWILLYCAIESDKVCEEWKLYVGPYIYLECCAKEMDKCLKRLGYWPRRPRP